jgi:hypothetical protein
VQSSRAGVTRRGDAVRAGGMRWRHVHETEGRQGVEAFFPGAVQGTPAGGQRVDDLIGEPDDERMGSGSRFKA